MSPRGGLPSNLFGKDWPPIHIDVAEIEMDTPGVIALSKVIEKCSRILDIFETSPCYRRSRQAD